MENSNNTPEAPKAPETAAAPASPQAPTQSNLAPTTKGNVAGGWNRFATPPKKTEGKFRSKDRRDGGSRGSR